MSLAEFLLNDCCCFFICRGPVHKERRNYLRTALKEMSLILSDQPGLLGPKVEVSFFSYHVACFIEHRVLMYIRLTAFPNTEDSTEKKVLCKSNASEMREFHSLFL